MRSLDDYKVVFSAVVLILALLVASPAIRRLLVLPRTEFFSELWMLGPDHQAENYPYNISRNHNYTVFLGIGNHLGRCSYYLVEVKFHGKSQYGSENLDSSFNGSSPLPSLYNITAFASSEGVWERPLTFSFDYAYNVTLSLVRFYSLTLNSIKLAMTNYQTTWNQSTKEFYGNLFFELWLYNVTTSSFQFHGRYVNLRLNMTIS